MQHSWKQTISAPRLAARRVNSRMRPRLYALSPSRCSNWAVPIRMSRMFVPRVHEVRSPHTTPFDVASHDASYDFPDVSNTCTDAVLGRCILTFSRREKVPRRGG